MVFSVLLRTDVGNTPGGPSRSRFQRFGLVSAALLLPSCAGAPPGPPLARTRDLILAFPSARIEAPGIPPGKPLSDYAHLQLLTSGGESLTAIFVHPPARVSFTLDILPGAVLETAVGIADSAADESDGAVYFVEMEQRGRTERVALRRIDPRLAGDRGWQPLSVDLSRFEGRATTLTLGAEPGSDTSKDWGGFAFPQIRSLGRRGHGKPFGERSVVLVSLDTLRADVIGANGHPGGLTPRLDAALRSCRHFPDAMSPSHWTLPAHMSLFSSTHPDVHGVSEPDESLSRDLQTLPEILEALGYATAAFVGDVGWLRAAHGFSRGFHTYLATFEPSAARIRRVREHLEGLAGERVFLFVHLFDAHSDFGAIPYEATPSSALLYAPLRVRGPACEGYRCASAELQERNRSRERYAAEGELAMRQMYEAGVADLDQEVGRLLAELRGIGLMERALLVLFSDHGEELGDHGMYLHEQVYPELTRALVAFREPGGAGSLGEGRPSLVDLAPTILHFARISPRPDTWQGASLLRGAPDTVYAVSQRGDRVLRDGRMTLWRDPKGGVVAFDRAADPGERRPLDPHPPGALLKELEARRAENEALASRLAPGRIAVSEEEEANLRALGYLDHE